MEDHEAAAFIEAELLAEMVHNRCFCEKDSREFVAFGSCKIKPIGDQWSGLHRVEALVRFSGEPVTFKLLVKLPDQMIDSCCSVMFFEKLAASYEMRYAAVGDEVPWAKVYEADPGTKYGTPVIVFDDLESKGFERVTGRDLNEEEARAAARMIGRFHRMGMELMQETAFRELSEKLRNENREKQALHDLASSADFPGLADVDSLSIVQGQLCRDNLLFKRSSDNLEVRAQDWRFCRSGKTLLDLARLRNDCAPEVDWPRVLEDYKKALTDRD